MKPIVIATDGSPSAVEATLRALGLARALETSLVAISVENPQYVGAGYYGSAQIINELSRTEAERVERSLAEARDLTAGAGVACELVHATGRIADAICRVAAERQAEMIVIGAHGWGPIRRVLHGSVSTAVVHESPVPVLVVPRSSPTLAESPAPRETAAFS